MTCLNIFTKEDGHRPVVCVSSIIAGLQFVLLHNTVVS